MGLDFIEKTIYYHDTDAGGVVYYGRYLNYLEEARTEFLHNKRISAVQFQEEGFHYAVRKCLIEYKSPARYGDKVICQAAIKKVTAAQIIFDQAITSKADGRLLVKAEVTIVCLNKEFKPTVIPDEIRRKLL